MSSEIRGLFVYLVPKTDDRPTKSLGMGKHVEDPRI